MENHGEPGKHGKYQIVDLIHSIYDFKNYICDSNQSFCQMDDSKHSHLLAFMATVQKLQPTGIVLAGCCTYTQSNSIIHLAKRFTVSSCIVSISNKCASSHFLWRTLQNNTTCNTNRSHKCW